VAHIGVVFGQRTQLWWDLPVIESYELLRHIYRVDAGAYGRQLDRLVHLLEIGPLLDTPVRKLSLGERMRCELAAALIHSPDLIFLDEPTIGLDVVAKETMRTFLAAENRERGTTVLLTTHYLEEAEELCDQIAIINHGRVIACDTTRNLLQRLDSKELVFILAEDLAQLPAPLTRFHAELQGPRRLVLRYRPSEMPMGDILAAVQAAGLKVADMTTLEADLQDIFLQLTRGDQAAAAR